MFSVGCLGLLPSVQRRKPSRFIRREISRMGESGCEILQRDTSQIFITAGGDYGVLRHHD